MLDAQRGFLCATNVVVNKFFCTRKTLHNYDLQWNMRALQIIIPAAVTLVVVDADVVKASAFTFHIRSTVLACYNRLSLGARIHHCSFE